MAAHVPAWTDLVAHGLEPNVFHEPAFALPAARFVPTRIRPRFLLVWDGAGRDRLIGLCCVTIPSLGLPASAWLHPQATAAFPLLDREAARDAWSVMLDWTGRARLRPAGLLLHGVPAEGATAQLLRAGGPWHALDLERRGRAVLRAGEPPALMRGKAGKEFRRQARRLGERGDLSVKTAATRETVAIEIEAFLELEAAGWKGRRGTAFLRSPGLAAFVRAMTAGLAAGDGCRLVRLDLDGRPLAIGIVLRSRGHAYYWKTAYDEAFARFSPGVHLSEAIGRSRMLGSGVELIDSCAIPDHAMIDRLWPGRLTVVDLLVAPAPASSLGLRLALLVERVRRRTKNALKRGRARAGFSKRPSVAAPFLTNRGHDPRDGGAPV